VAKKRKKPAENDHPRSQKVVWITKWMIEGIRPSDWMAEANSLGWWATAEEIAELVATARMVIAADALTDRDSAKKVAVLRLEECFRDAVRLKRPDVALAAQKELNRILRLHLPTPNETEDNEATRFVELAHALGG